MNDILGLIQEQYNETLRILVDNIDADLRSYYEGRRDVLYELLATIRLAEMVGRL